MVEAIRGAKEHELLRCFVAFVRTPVNQGVGHWRGMERG